MLCDTGVPMAMPRPSESESAEATDMLCVRDGSVGESDEDEGRRAGKAREPQQDAFLSSPKHSGRVVKKEYQFASLSLDTETQAHTVVAARPCPHNVPRTEQLQQMRTKGRQTDKERESVCVSVCECV